MPLLNIKVEVGMGFVAKSTLRKVIDLRGSDAIYDAHDLKTGEMIHERRICSTRRLLTWAERLATEEEMGRLGHERPVQECDRLFVDFMDEYLGSLPTETLLAELERRGLLTDQDGRYVVVIPEDG